MDKRRITSCLLSAAGSFAAVGLMLGGWLFSLRELCAIPVEDLSLLGWCFLISLAAAALTCLYQSETQPYFILLKSLRLVVFPPTILLFSTSVSPSGLNKGLIFNSSIFFS